MQCDALSGLFLIVANWNVQDVMERYAKPLSTLSETEDNCGALG